MATPRNSHCCDVEGAGFGLSPFFCCLCGVGGVFSIRRSTSSSLCSSVGAGMATDSSTEFPYDANIEFKREYLRKGQHLAILPLDLNVSALIGRVTAYWGYYETMFNQLLGQMLAAAERAELNWHLRSFAKRTDLARELMDQVVFPLADEQAKRRIRGCLDRAGDLQWRRNVIVHGNLRMNIGPRSSAATFHAEGTHKSKKVTVPLDPANLQKLWHDIAHLAGEFIEVAKLIGTVEGLAHTLPDKQILDLFREWDRKSSPTQQTP